MQTEANKNDFVFIFELTNFVYMHKKWVVRAPVILESFEDLYTDGDSVEKERSIISDRTHATINISLNQDKQSHVSRRHQSLWPLVLSMDKCDRHLGIDQVQKRDTPPDRY